MNESNEQALIELSKRVAEKLGIEADKYYKYCHDPKIDEVIWLHEDSKRCFELMVEREISLEWWLMKAGEKAYAVNVTGFPFEEYSDYNNDRALATRVAILKALEAL